MLSKTLRHLRVIMKLSLSQMETVAALLGSETYVEAGHKLGKSDVAVGRQVRQIEQILGRSITYRSSTRRLSLTEFGAEIAERYATILKELEGVTQWATVEDVEASGTVHVAYHDEEVFHATLLPLLPEFCNRFPGINIQLEQIKPIVRHGSYTADVYWGVGEYFKQMNPKLTQKPLLNIDYGLFAAGSYLNKHGEPSTLKALESHHIITSYSRLPDDSLFCFDRNASERFKTIKARNRLRVTNHVLDLACAGLGIVNAPYNTMTMSKLLQEGKLKPILKPHWIKGIGMYVYYDASFSKTHPAKQFTDYCLQQSDKFLLTR